MKVLTLGQQKGGVSKTTLAINLACCAVRDGVKTVLFEMDKQSSVGEWFAERGERAPYALQIATGTLGAMLDDMGAHGFELVVVDVPGTASNAAREAIKNADLCLIPGRPFSTDLMPAAATVETCNQLATRYAFVISIAPTASGRSEEAKEALRKAGHDTLDAVIVNRVSHADAISAGDSIIEWQPNSAGAREIEAAWKEVRERLEYDEQRATDAA